MSNPHPAAGTHNDQRQTEAAPQNESTAAEAHPQNELEAATQNEPANKVGQWFVFLTLLFLSVGLVVATSACNTIKKGIVSIFFVLLALLLSCFAFPTIGNRLYEEFNEILSPWITNEMALRKVFSFITLLIVMILFYGAIAGLGVLDLLGKICSQNI